MMIISFVLDKIVENSELSQQLWQVSERITGLSQPGGACTEICQGVVDIEEGITDLPLSFAQGSVNCNTPLVYAQA